MRVPIDIPEPQLRELTGLSKRKKVSRATLIREAISLYLEQARQDAMRNAFGLWGDQKLDGLEYQRKLREEWRDR